MSDAAGVSAATAKPPAAAAPAAAPKPKRATRGLFDDGGDDDGSLFGSGTATKPLSSAKYKGLFDD